MVDLGSERGGEAWRGVEPACCEIPWPRGVCVSSGDVWSEGRGGASTCEVKSPDDLGVFEGRPRLRGAVRVLIRFTELAPEDKFRRLTIIISLWIVAILFGRSTSLETPGSGICGWLQHTYYNTRIQSVTNLIAMELMKNDELGLRAQTTGGDKKNDHQGRSRGQGAMTNRCEIYVPLEFRAAGLMVPEPSLMAPIPFKAFVGW